MELGVEVCMTECDEEVMDMMVVCVSNEQRFCCHFLNVSCAWGFLSSLDLWLYHFHQIWKILTIVFFCPVLLTPLL